MRDDWVIEVSWRPTEGMREVAHENEEVRIQLLSFRPLLKPSFDALEGLSMSWIISHLGFKRRSG